MCNVSVEGLASQTQHLWPKYEGCAGLIPWMGWSRWVLQRVYSTWNMHNGWSSTGAFDSRRRIPRCCTVAIKEGSKCLLWVQQIKLFTLIVHFQIQQQYSTLNTQSLTLSLTFTASEGDWPGLKIVSFYSPTFLQMFWMNSMSCIDVQLICVFAVHSVTGGSWHGAGWSRLEDLSSTAQWGSAWLRSHVCYWC